MTSAMLFTDVILKSVFKVQCGQLCSPVALLKCCPCSLLIQICLKIFILCVENQNLKSCQVNPNKQQNQANKTVSFLGNLLNTVEMLRCVCGGVCIINLPCFVCFM